MSKLKNLFDKLSNVAPNLFEAEVAAGLGYAVVLFNLHISDTQRAAALGAVVLVFTLAQIGYKAFEGK